MKNHQDSNGETAQTEKRKEIIAESGKEGEEIDDDSTSKVDTSADSEIKA